MTFCILCRRNSQIGIHAYIIFQIYIYIIFHICYNWDMNYYEITKSDIETQQHLLDKYKEQLLKLPDYNMVSQRKGNNIIYYLCKGKKRKCLSVKDQALIHDIKTRHFMQAAIRTLERNVRLQQKIISSYKPYDYAAINNSLPKTYRLDNLPQPVIIHNDSGKLLHRTSFGLQVRSKSEALIAEILHAENISFRYELPLTLYDNGSPAIVHPDFTIFTSGKGKVYWEHMGMIANEDYRTGAVKRFALYCNNGITMPDKLMITMDTVDGSIDVLAAKKLLDTVLSLNNAT